MNRKRQHTISALSGILMALGLTCGVASAQNVIVGVNWVKQPGLTVEQQNVILSDMKAVGVRVIRTGITPDDAGIDFAKRAFAQGIEIDWLVALQYRPDAPTRPWQPKEYPHAYSGHPLSSADPDLFRAYLQPVLDKLDAQGVKLAGLELGNEINGTGFNAEFPLPGEGKQFGLSDLYHDPEAQQIAKGYLQYLKVLSVLKDLRDHSKVNRKTPILTAGFVAYEAPEGKIPGWHTDMVSLSATLDFMRANGLDKIVDAYAVHVYPWANGPGNANAAAGRQHRLAQFVLPECRPTGSAEGKPCWITEWGFANKSQSCPVDEVNQLTLVKEMRNNFRPYIRDGRLQGLLYYAWLDNSEDFALFRCGSLTQSGHVALAPW
jgi:hypothetical protein